MAFVEELDLFDEVSFVQRDEEGDATSGIHKSNNCIMKQRTSPFKVFLEIKFFLSVVSICF